MTKYCRVVAAFVTMTFLLLSQFGHSATSFVSGAGIYQLRALSSGNFGNCVATLSKDINTSGSAQLNCGKNLIVSFGCDGASQNTKSEGAQLFSQAQLAFAMGRQIDLVVDDSYQYGTNTCVATAVYVKGASFP